MNAGRFAMGRFILAGLAVAFWLLGGVNNPLLDGTLASRERLSSDSEPVPEHDPLKQFADSVIEPPAGGTVVQGRIYVPAYAQIRLGSGRGKLDLATTLSIHNTSADRPIAVRKVSYHGTDGSLVETFLARPIGLRPLATIEFFVAAADVRAGSGANFLVEWSSPEPVSEPATEAVMIGAIGTTSYSFVSQGRSAMNTCSKVVSPGATRP